MSARDDTEVPIWFITFLIVFAFPLGVGVGRCQQRDTARAEAVKEGHAKWEVVNESGETKFVWLPKPTKEEPAK